MPEQLRVSVLLPFAPGLFKVPLTEHLKKSYHVPDNLTCILFRKRSAKTWFPYSDRLPDQIRARIGTANCRCPQSFCQPCGMVLIMRHEWFFHTRGHDFRARTADPEPRTMISLTAIPYELRFVTIRCFEHRC